MERLALCCSGYKQVRGNASVIKIEKMCHCHSNFILDILKGISGPIFIGFLSYVITAKLDDWKNRRKQSKLGVAIMDSLIEEVENGIRILTHYQNSNEVPTVFMPTKSWNGQTTINDEVLLRIIETSENIKADHFPPKDIRIHCKNYFDMIAGQWNQNINSLEKGVPVALVISMARQLASNGSQTLEGSKGVLKMLQQTRTLLLNNSKTVIPK